MTLLNRLFGSTESIAKHGKKDEQIILRSWKEYLSTIPEKEHIINHLPFSFGERKNLLRRLEKLLRLELADVFTAEKEEDDLVLNLRSLEHSKKIRRVHRLEDCLMYFETRHEYVYELLRHLYTVLKSEASLVVKLTNNKDLRKFRKLVGHLKSEFEVEQTLLKKIEEIETFHNLFSALVKGEHIIRSMDSREKRLLKKMQNRINRIFSDEVTEGITYEWATMVYNDVQDIVMNHEAIMANGYDPHPDVDFQFVNGPKFVDLVRENIQYLRKRKVSEQMINVFVRLFREWYNHGRG